MSYHAEFQLKGSFCQETQRASITWELEQVRSPVAM